VTRTVDGEPRPLDAQQLVIELRPLLGVPDALLGTYLEEIAATLAASAWKVAHPEGRRVAELVTADLATVEAAMTEGHPGFVANSGRIGFGVSDHRAYAPEAAGDVRLVWLAAHRDHTHLASCEGVTERELYASQVGDDVLACFSDRLRSLGLDPDDYLYLPAHPWQWEHKIAVTFAPDVAARRLVPLGPGPDAYRAQQSIRTFLDVDRPDRHYVKVALAIQNMGFLRGLSPAYMRVTPAINDHVARMVAADPEFAACGFEVLREVASIGYTGDAYHRAGDVTGPAPAQRRMVAALWRESPVPRLGEGERAATMAALLHRDPDGAHLATAWVERSGLDPVTWLRAYLRVYLRPVAHALLAHDLAFMPHGENVILVLRDGLPVRAMLKDIGEEVVALHDRPLPPDVERIRMKTTPEVAALSVHTDVFDGVLRHLAGILDADGALPAKTFWDEVGRCLAGHATDHPEAHDRVDLFADRFDHSCLNRLQLRNTLQMVDLTDQASSLIMAGTLPNPVAGHRPGTTGKHSRSAEPVPARWISSSAASTSRP
jgi:siderophore synthetase component